jgi:predicted peptidase
MAIRWVAVLCGMTIALSVHAADRGLSAGRSAHRLVLHEQADDHVNYLLYVPPGSSPAGGWPTILFLHGSEQRGDNPSMLEDLAILAFADRVGGLPFVAILPQCPRGEHWSPGVLRQVLDAVEEEVPVDRGRVYLTGFSMGGYGTWQTAAAMPGVFAAIAPLCGVADLEDVPHLVGIPTWVFHGARDRNVPISESVTMVRALRRAGGHPNFTVYPDREHDIWTMTYRDSRLYLWFLSHTLPSSSAGGFSIPAAAGSSAGESGTSAVPGGSGDSRIAASSASSDALLDR